MEGRLEALIQRLEQLADRLERGAGGAAPAADEPEVNPYAEFEAEKLDPILALAETLPETVKKMTQLFVEAHKTAGKIVAMSLKCKKPADADLVKLHDPVTKAVNEIEKLGGFRQDEQFNHGQLLKEAAKTASWVVASRTPADYIDNTFQVGEYYGLQVVRKYKGKADEHAKWFQAIKAFCLALQEFVKDNYRTGLTWNPKGVDVSEFKAGGAPAPASSSGAVPPPPPVPAAPPVTAAPEAPAKPKVDIGALMSELNQGEGITGRLRKVLDSEKTKNRPKEERVFTVPEEVGVKKAAPATPAKAVAKPPPPPVFQVRGMKLQVENQVNNQEMKYESAGIQQTIYMYNCKNSALIVTGKLNQVVVDKCTKCKIIVDDVISSFEIVNSRDIDVQVMHVCSSVDAESSESVRVYLSEEGMKKVEIFSAKSSNVSIYAPGIRIDPDTNEKIEGMIEHALPSTLRSVFEGGNLSHSFVKHG